MQARLRQGWATLLFLCAVLCAFYMREHAQPDYMQIPVRQVLAYVSETKSPDVQYREEREVQRTQEMAALSALAQSGDQQAGSYLQTLVQWAELELAAEAALEAMGYERVVCAVRENSVFVCLWEALEASSAQKIIELCEKITGAGAENIFILDECGYS